MRKITVNTIIFLKAFYPQNKKINFVTFHNELMRGVNSNIGAASYEQFNLPWGYTQYDYSNGYPRAVPGDNEGISSYTIVVEEGKIGYINCIFLDWVGKSQSSDIQAQLAEIQAKKDAEKNKVPITSYNVVQKPTKLSYKYGEKFIIDGLVVESVDAKGTHVKIDNSRIILMFVVGDDWTKIWSAQRGGTGFNYTIPLKNANTLKLFVDEEDTGATINMELKK